jgi:hypothetical protein
VRLHSWERLCQFVGMLKAAWCTRAVLIEIELYEYKIRNTCDGSYGWRGTESHTPLATGRKFVDNTRLQQGRYHIEF